MPVMNALSGVITLLIIIAAGIIIYMKGGITGEAEAAITTLAMKYSVPFLLFSNALKYISFEFLTGTGRWFLIFALVILINIAAAVLLSHIFKIKETNRGLFKVMSSFSNTIFIGLPVGTAIFGDAAVPYIMTAYLPNTLLFWTLGNTFLSSDGGNQIKFGAGTIKSVFPPPVIGFLAGSAIALTGIHLPGFITSAVSYLGNMTVPLTLILTGFFIAKKGKNAFKLSKELILTLFSRLIFSPLIAFCVCRLFGASAMMTSVLTVMAALPTMNQSVAMTRYYGGDASLAAQGLVMTTALTMVFIPLYIFILSFFVTIY